MRSENNFTSAKEEEERHITHLLRVSHLSPALSSGHDLRFEHPFRRHLYTPGLFILSSSPSSFSFLPRAARCKNFPLRIVDAYSRFDRETAIETHRVRVSRYYNGFASRSSISSAIAAAIYTYILFSSRKTLQYIYVAHTHEVSKQVASERVFNTLFRPNNNRVL